MNPAPTNTSTIAIGYDWLRQNMLEEGEFDKTVTRNGIEAVSYTHLTLPTKRIV